MAHEKECRIHNPQGFDDHGSCSINELRSVEEHVRDLTDDQLRAELTRREEERDKVAARARHNSPILKQIDKLEKELKTLKDRLQ